MTPTITTAAISPPAVFATEEVLFPADSFSVIALTTMYVDNW